MPEEWRSKQSSYSLSPNLSGVLSKLDCVRRGGRKPRDVTGFREDPALTPPLSPFTRHCLSMRVLVQRLQSTCTKEPRVHPEHSFPSTSSLFVLLPSLPARHRGQERQVCVTRKKVRPPKSFQKLSLQFRGEEKKKKVGPKKKFARATQTQRFDRSSSNSRPASSRLSSRRRHPFAARV